MQFMDEGVRLGERYEGKSLAENLEVEELSREFGIDPEKVRQITEKAQEGMKKFAQRVRELEQKVLES